VDNKNTDLLSKHTLKKKRKKQTHLASGHNEKNRWRSGRVFGGMSMPKVSIDHRGFRRSDRPHGWDDREEKTERNIEFTYATTGVTQRRTRRVASEKRQE